MCTSRHSHSNTHYPKSFRIHLLNYLLVIGSLWVIWAMTGTGHAWPVYPMLGWGIGLANHYAAATSRRTQRQPPTRPAQERQSNSYQEQWDGQEVRVHERSA